VQADDAGGAAGGAVAHCRVPPRRCPRPHRRRLLVAHPPTHAMETKFTTTFPSMTQLCSYVLLQDPNNI